MIFEAMIVTLFASFSTVLGGYLCRYTKYSNKNFLAFILAFTAGVMLFISFFDILPVSFLALQNRKEQFCLLLFCLLGVVLGYLCKNIINRFVISNNKTYKSALITTLTIATHNFPEGLITFLVTSKDLKLGIGLAISIALHNIIEGIAIGVPLLNSTKNKKLVIRYTFFSGISEFIGALFGFALFSFGFQGFNANYLMGLVAGIMIIVSIDELVVESFQIHKRICGLGLIIGMICMFIFGIIF